MPLDTVDLRECCVCRGVYITIEMPEVNVECLPQLLFILFYETRSLADPEAHQFGLTSWSANPRCPFVSVCPT